MKKILFFVCIACFTLSAQAVFTDDFDALSLTISKAEFISIDDAYNELVLEPPAVLVLQNINGSARVSAAGLVPGLYKRVILSIIPEAANNQVLVGTESFPLTAIANKVSFVGNFEINAEGLLAFDVDLSKVLHLPRGNGRFGQSYRIKPTVPILPALEN